MQFYALHTNSFIHVLIKKKSGSTCRINCWKISTIGWLDTCPSVVVVCVQNTSKFLHSSDTVVKTRLQTLQKGQGERQYAGILDCFA